MFVSFVKHHLIFACPDLEHQKTGFHSDLQCFTFTVLLPVSTMSQHGEGLTIFYILWLQRLLLLYQAPEDNQLLQVLFSPPRLHITSAQCALSLKLISVGYAISSDQMP